MSIPFSHAPALPLTCIWSRLCYVRVWPQLYNNLLLWTKFNIGLIQSDRFEADRESEGGEGEEE